MRWRWAFLPLLVILMSASGVRAGDSTRPVSAADSEPILRDGTSPDAGSGATTRKTADSSANSLNPTQVILALGAVLALIFVLRWGVKKLVPGTAGVRSTSAMKVVSRCMISPKQRLLLVQVGKRLVVVGDGGAQLNPLCQITDAEEVSAILTQVRDESSSIVSKFDSIFGRAKKGFEGDGEVDEQVTPAEGDGAEEAGDPAIEATRDELAGLSSKVRGLAQQLGRA